MFNFMAYRDIATNLDGTKSSREIDRKSHSHTGTKKKNQKRPKRHKTYGINKRRG